mmetsp:Transcript_7266/g.6399  ORF Transcript_7266/g.6399 Transcript_7266/m.6399 type:complete len:122 (+) Transcript_7266:1528-1893(+)
MEQCTFQPNLKKELKRSEYADEGTTLFNRKVVGDEISHPVNTHDFSSFISDPNFGLANIKSQQTPPFKNSFKPKLNNSHSSQNISVDKHQNLGKTSQPLNKSKFIVNEITINLGAEQQKQN